MKPDTAKAKSLLDAARREVRALEKIPLDLADAAFKECADTVADEIETL